MSIVHVSRITPSKFGDGDRWRLEIDGEWYDAYLTPEAAGLTAGDYDVEFKTSPKTGKSYAVAINGMFRTNGAQRAPQRSNVVPGSLPARPAPVPTVAALPAETKPGAKDMWIMATSICQAVIAKGESWEHGALVELAREAANAARAAARVFDGAPLDAVRAAVTLPNSAELGRPYATADRATARTPQADPEDPRQAGPDFDDDIPF
jgi:hypothetical protein